MCANLRFPGLRPLDETRDYALRVLQATAEARLPRHVHLAGYGPAAKSSSHGPLEAQSRPRLDVVLDGEQEQVLVGHQTKPVAAAVRMHAGEAVFFPPFAPYLPLWGPPCLGLGVVWDEHYVRVVSYEHRGGYRGILRSPYAYHTAHPVGDCGRHLIDAMAVMPPGEDAAGDRGALARLLLAETRRHLATDAGQPRFASKAAHTWFLAERFIDLHLHEPLSRDDVAGAAGVTGPYLSRLCRRQTGRTYQHHLIHLRLDRAKQLLTQTAMKVGEVATACGFAHARHFSDAFTREIGDAPGRWRRAEQGR